MTNTKQVYNMVFKTLSDQYAVDSEFQKELEEILYFYGQKFIQLSKNDEQKEYIESHLFDLIKSQFFQGYYIMKNILTDDESELPDDIWGLAKGIIRNEIPILMKKMFEDSQEEWFRTDIGQQIGMNLILKFQNVYELVQQTRKEVALFGAYKAFIEDNRYKGIDETVNLHLGNPFDLTFLNPQVYMKAQFLTEEQEIWDLYTWSSFKEEGSWIGTIQLSSIPNLQAQNLYLLQLTISETIVNFEKYQILNSLIDNLPNEMKSLLQIRIHHVRELENFSYSIKNDRQ